MGKKEFTKKQLRKQLTTLNEGSVQLKQDMKKSFDALKRLDRVMTGQKIGDVTITKSMNKKIKNAKRYIEDLWDKITDGEIEEKESEEEEKVAKKNEQSEGHGKMYNALKGVREGKAIKINQSTLKRIVGRVIKEQNRDPESKRNEFLEAYGEMHSHVLNMFYLDKQQIGSHDADKIVMNWRRFQKKIDREMRGACESYERAERYFRESGLSIDHGDDWYGNE